MPLTQSLTNSFFRQVCLVRLLNYEHTHFLKLSPHSGVKNCLKRMKDSYESNMPSLLSYAGIENRSQFDVAMSEEKMQAISGILDKLVMMSEADVLIFEDDFNKVVEVR